MAGRKNWYFADGYLPEKVAGGAMEAHEALICQFGRLDTTQNAMSYYVGVVYAE